jgi:hypothetical protein
VLHASNPGCPPFVSCFTFAADGTFAMINKLKPRQPEEYFVRRAKTRCQNPQDNEIFFFHGASQ